MKFISAALLTLSLAAPVYAANANLYEQIWAGQAEQVITAMQQDKALVNAKLDGYTPLHLVSMNGSKEIARFLLDNGADVNARDFEGYSPLVRANANGNKEISAMLIERGAKELRP